jgi:hypothetical protein
MVPPYVPAEGLAAADGVVAAADAGAVAVAVAGLTEVDAGGAEVVATWDGCWVCATGVVADGVAEALQPTINEAHKIRIHTGIISLFILKPPPSIVLLFLAR